MSETKQAIRNISVLAAFLAAVLLLWQAVSSLALLPSYACPSPTLRPSAAAWWSSRGRLAVAERQGLPGAHGPGFLVSAALGLMLGLAMGMSETVNTCLRSVFLGLQTLPSAAWVPISLLVFGLSDTAIYFVIVMSSTTAMAIATADGISHIPPVLLRAAQTLGTTRRAMSTRVVLPAALPSIVTGIKLGWTLGWHGVVSAELIKSSVGLGFLLHAGRELNDAAQVIGVMLVTVFIGLILDRLLFAAVERRVRIRWGFAPAASQA
jgi:NitT/TauT family transport system permease protein